MSTADGSGGSKAVEEKLPEPFALADLATQLGVETPGRCAIARWPAPSSEAIRGHCIIARRVTGGVPICH